MPTLYLQLPAAVSRADLNALQAELASQASVYEPPAESYDPAAVIMAISFFSDLLQGADVLANWLGRTPRTNEATIRFTDGRTIRYQDDDPEAFRRALRAALK